MNEEEAKRETIQKLIDHSKRIGYIKAQNQMLHFVWELSKQGKISNEVAALFALEFTLDLE